MLWLFWLDEPCSLGFNEGNWWNTKPISSKACCNCSGLDTQFLGGLLELFNDKFRSAHFISWGREAEILAIGVYRFVRMWRSQCSEEKSFGDESKLTTARSLVSDLGAKNKEVFILGEEEQVGELWGSLSILGSATSLLILASNGSAYGQLDKLLRLKSTA